MMTTETKNTVIEGQAVETPAEGTATETSNVESQPKSRPTPVEEPQESAEEHTKNRPTPEEKLRESAENVKQAATKLFNEASKQIEKQVETFSGVFSSALQDRSNVVMVRVNDDALSYLDMMIEADVVKSRSEGAALLINAGIEANGDLFSKIRDVSEQITALRSQLKETVGAK